MDIFDTAFYVLLAIAVVVLIYIVGVNLISGTIYPMMYKFRPTNNSSGISETLYVQKMDRLKAGFFWIFYIIMAIPFIYFIIKTLYEREETSVYGGAYR